MPAMTLCPACNEQGTPPKGQKNSPYLLIFTKPYPTSAVRNWKDKLTGLDVLRKEFQKVGLDLNEFRMVYLWLHEPTKNEDCYSAGKSIVLDEAKGRKAVILVGSEVTEEFCGLSASDTAGLVVDAPALSASLVFVLPKPEGVFVKGSGVGELRLACQKLAKEIERSEKKD